MSEVLEVIDDADELAPLHSKIAAALPAGWKLETLGSLCEKSQYGWTTKADKSGAGVKFLRTTDITPGHVDWQSVPYCVEAPADLEKYLIKDGDILISRTGSIGVNYLVVQPEPAVFASYLIRFRPKTSISTKYLKYYLQSPAYWRAINAGKKGIAVQNVNATMLSRIPVPVAPAGVQEEIVAEIEKQFSRLDEAVANLQRVKANLKRYKAAVLKAAVEGRLVETEAELARRAGRSYETGEQLLLRIIEQRKAMAKGNRVAINQPETIGFSTCPDGWVWTTCDAAINGIDAGASFKCDERPPVDGEVGVLKVSALTWGSYDESQSKTCKDADRIEEKYVVRDGDFLFSRANTIELVGACVIVGKVTKQLMLSDKTLRFDVSEKVLPEWLQICLRCKFGREEIERLATGNQESMRNIGQERIRQIRMPLPPLIEQVRIVAEVDRCLSIVREVEAEVDANLQRAQALRSAVLSRAFSGDMSSRVSNERDDADSQKLVVKNLSRLEPVSVVMTARILGDLAGESTMGRVKLQKILYLATYHGKVDAANAEYVRMQAGPLDMPMLEGVIKRLNELGWFREIARNGKSTQQKAYSYTPLTKAEEHKKHLGVLTTDQISAIDQMVRLMRSWATEQCELLATVYGAWNDLIIWKLPPTVDAIVHEVLENWHEAKRKFSRQQISQMVDQIKRLGIEPSGFGLPTSGSVPDAASRPLFED